MKMRNHWIEFVYQNVQTIRNFFVPFVGVTIFNPTSLQWPVIVGIFAVLTVLWSFVSWFNHTFSLTENSIVIERGVLSKSVNTIPLESVRSVHTSDSLIKRWLKIENVKVETIGGDEVLFVLKHAVVQRLEKEIFKQPLSTKPSNNTWRLGIKDLVILSLDVRILLPAISFGFWLFGKATDWLKDDLPKGSFLKSDAKNVLHLSFWLEHGWVIFLSAVGLLLLIWVASGIRTFLKYGRYVLSRESEELIVSYGVLNRKTYRIPVHYIRSIVLEEPLRFLMTGSVRVKVENVGIGSGEEATIELFPIVQKQRLQTYLNAYLPEFTYEKPRTKSPTQGYILYALHNLFSGFSLFIYVLLGFLIYYTSLSIYSYAGWLIIVWLHSYIQWKNNAVGYKQKGFITVQRWRRGKRETTVFLSHYLQSVKCIQTGIDRACRVQTYTLYVYSEALIEEYTIRHIEMSLKQNFYKILQKKV